MIKKDNNSIFSVYDETTVIGKIYKGIVKLYESWRKLLESGIPPLTLLKCKLANLVDYKIYGNSLQGENLIDYDYFISLNGNSTYYYVDDDGNLVQKKQDYRSNIADIPVILTLQPGSYTYSASAKNRYFYLDDKMASSASFVIDKETTFKFKSWDSVGTIVNPVLKKAPTPDIPIEIESVGDKTANLCEEMQFTSNELATVEPYKDGFKATAKQGSSGYNNYVKSGVMLHLNKLEWGKTYTLSCYVEQSNSNMSSLLRIGYSDASTNVWRDFKNKGATNNSINVITFTLPDEQPANMGSDKGVQMLVNVQRATLDTLETITITDIMLVEGEEPAEYEPKGYKIPVKVRGKNHFDISKIKTDDVLHINGSEIHIKNTYARNCPKVITLLPNTTYTISCYLTKLKNPDTTKQTFSGRIMLYDSANNGIALLRPSIGVDYYNQYISRTFTTPDNIEDYTTITFYGNTELSDVIFKDVQIEEGSVATECEPYIEPITTNIYLNEPLRKNGDYVDYIDFEKGKVIRNVWFRAFTGGETIGVPGTAIEGYTPFRYIESENISYPFVCNYLPFVNSNYSAVSNTECLARYSPSGRQMFFIISNQRIALNDTTAFKNWLKELYSSGKPLKVYAGLNEPNDTETIDLPDILLNKGTNIIEVDTTISPSNMEVAYLGKK